MIDTQISQLKGTAASAVPAADMPGRVGAMQALYTSAVQKHRAGDYATAENLYNQILAMDPNQIDAQHLLGLVFGQTDRRDKALELISAALRARPESAIFHSNYANVLRRENRLAEALFHYRNAVQLDSGFADAFANMSGALTSEERYEEAENAARRALELDPGHHVAFANLGGSLIGQGRLEEAAGYIDQARSLGKDTAEIWLNHGFLKLADSDFDAAAASFRAAIERDTSLIDSYRGLGFALVRQRKISEAIQNLRHYISKQPGPSSATAMLGHLEMIYGDFEAGRSAMFDAVSREGANAEEHSTYLFNLNYGPKIDQKEVCKSHAAWSLRHGVARVSPKPFHGHEIKRIGFVSADFRGHSVSFFFLPLLEELTKRGIECYCYSNVPKEDIVSEQIRHIATSWKPIYGVADITCAEMIVNDRIDVLVDLSGHTADNRLSLFSMQPAPLQVTYLGYPNTTGLEEIGFRIVDIMTDPITQTWFGSEQLLRLPRSFLCYRPTSYPAIAPAPSLTGKPVTFGSFNNISKLNADVISVWSDILRAMPGSRMLLKHDAAKDAMVQDHLLCHFRNEGIDLRRINFVDRTPDLQSHLEMYAQVDVALDPFPYNGTTTTCEALWMGVPVVTLEGNRHAARVGASILATIGFEAGIAGSRDDYITTAVELGKNPNLLASIRDMLRQSMSDSPLCDEPGLADEWLGAIREAWQVTHDPESAAHVG